MNIDNYLKSIKCVVDMNKDEIRECNGVKVIAVIDHCDNCMFSSHCDKDTRRESIYPTFGECCCDKRDDGLGIVFKKIK